MTKQLPIFILAFLTTLVGFSQGSEKIKGSRNVTTEITEIVNFNRLVVEDDFKLNIKQGEQAAIQIDTDDNLHDVIEFNVSEEGSLSFKKNKRITSSKRLDITVIFKDSLDIIELKESAQITSLESLKLADFTLKTKESSKAFLTLEADDFSYTTAGRSKAELNVTAKKIMLEMNDNSNVKALFNADDIALNLLQRANARIEGDVKTLSINTDNSAILKADNLEAKDCNAIIAGKSDLHVQATGSLEIEATGTSEIYIYGNPKIDLKTFDDNAILRKK